MEGRNEGDQFFSVGWKPERGLLCTGDRDKDWFPAIIQSRKWTIYILYSSKEEKVRLPLDKLRYPTFTKTYEKILEGLHQSSHNKCIWMPQVGAN